MGFYKSGGLLLVSSGITHCKCHSWKEVKRGIGDKSRGVGSVRDRGVGRHGGISGDY